MLPYGLIKTIKLKREIKEKKRVTYAWFAPELDYLLVRLYQVKKGTEQFEAQLMVIDTKIEQAIKKQ
jgi:predicted homoserine dehydrogenase-like protein